jgi:predicted nucleotidyltransferase
MTRKDTDIAQRFKQLLQQRTIPLSVQVFGSRARGDALPESDLDLFVVVEQASRELEKYVSDCAWEAGFEEGVVVVPVVVDKARMAGPLGDSAFVRNVLREGVAV